MSTRLRRQAAGLVAGMALVAALGGCNAKELFRADEPQQKGRQNPLDERGARDQAQRQRDCWDMPSAQACYEVGLNYELGLNGATDLAEAQRYYDKACELDKDDEHCEAAKRLHDKP